MRKVVAAASTQSTQQIHPQHGCTGNAWQRASCSSTKGVCYAYLVDGWACCRSTWRGVSCWEAAPAQTPRYTTVELQQTMTRGMCLAGAQGTPSNGSSQLRTTAEVGSSVQCLFHKFVRGICRLKRAVTHQVDMVTQSGCVVQDLRMACMEMRD